VQPKRHTTSSEHCNNTPSGEHKYRNKKEERDPQQGETVQVGDALNDVIVNNQRLLRELERR